MRTQERLCAAYRVSNALKGAAVESGVWISVLETTVVANFLGGPWDSDANMGSFSHHAKQSLFESKYGNSLFLNFYGQCCREKGWDSIIFGTLEHIEKTWNDWAGKKCCSRRARM